MENEKITFNERNSFANELINSITHGIGALLSLIGLIVLVHKAILLEDAWYIVSYSIYGTSMLMLYTASTFYHSFSKNKYQPVFQKIDHIAIYLLIAGSYTPFTLITLRGAYGWILFAIIWAMAFGGIIFKLFFYTKKLRVLSAIIYLIMGWMVTIAIKPLIAALPFGGLAWLMAGGGFYTLGVVFYIWKSLPFSHGIWHLFVLGGSISIFACIFQYV